MTSSRPYLIRALYDWITDNDMTPHLLADAEVEGVLVPPQSIQNGKVTLNVAARAVDGLLLGDEHVEFQARFSGVSEHVVLPIPSILAIYARENGKGMMFPPEDESDDPGPSTPDEPGRPQLKVVK